MKKLIYIFAAAALIMSASCTKTADKTTETDSAQPQEQSQQQEQTQENTAAANLIELTGDDLTQLTAAQGQVLAIDFGATWCGPCQKFHPTFDEAATKYPAAKFVYVDIDENPQAAEKYNVEAVPTIIVIDTKGNESRYTGIEDLLPADKFFNIIENASK